MSSETDIRSRQIAAMEAARAAVDRAFALLRDDSQAGPAGAEGHGAEWNTLGRAADFRQCTEQTMQRLVIEHGLGVKTGGRWRVDLARLRR